MAKTEAKPRKSGELDVYTVLLVIVTLLLGAAVAYTVKQNMDLGSPDSRPGSAIEPVDLD
ncbi:MAG: hypothetical protein O2819_07115 [Planctomycetota bacterium]|nr:hypothetical protein [Planctomycetota bacterium]MDA1106055.1 hypothetical protein [Planctomycetota bacterium]